MAIRDIMKTDLITVQPTTSLQDAVQLLLTHKISGLPVVDSSNNVVGVMSEMDLINTLGEPHRTFRTVADIMTADPVTIAVDKPMVDVYDCLMTHTFRRVLIHNEGKLVGLISRADLMPTILESLAGT